MVYRIAPMIRVGMATVLLLSQLSCSDPDPQPTPDGTVSDAGQNDATQNDAALTDAGVPDSEVMQPVVAFPGAVGFGADTPGGRGGQVIEVTTLAASGTGSLREAIETAGPRIIVFRVGGIIDVTEDLRVTEPFCTIAGQTAPGDGITIRGASLRLRSHDIIVRGLRIRVGDGAEGPDPGSRDAIGIEHPDVPPYNIIVDHCSLSWAIDETMAIWYPAHDVTLSWNILSEGLFYSIHPSGPHSMGLIVGPYSERISIHHNLFAHNNDRNPLVSDAGSTEIVNNVVYNWRQWATHLSNCHSSEPSLSNVIGNYYLPGPDTSQPSPGAWPGGIRIYNSIDNACWHAGSVYVSGNVNPDYPAAEQDNWALVENMVGDSVRSDSLVFAPSSLEPSLADTAFDGVLLNAGAMAPARDPVDERVVQSVRDETGGLIDSQSEVGGWPVVAGGSPPPDSDHDGMPDQWELDSDLDPDDPTDGVELAPSGYTWVEEYINSLLPR